MVDELEEVGTIEDGREFSTCTAVVTPHADSAITGQPVRQISHLCDQGLLHTKQVRLLEVDKIDEVSASGCPAVARIVVPRVLVPDIVGTDVEVLCLCRKDSQQHKD